MPAPPAALALPEDTSQPIYVRTREAIRDQTQGTTTYRGDVRVRQGTIRIEADEVILTESPTPSGTEKGSDPFSGANTVVATGSPARLQQLPAVDSELAKASANRIEYLIPRSLIRMRQNARVQQGAMDMRAGRLEYFIDKQVMRAYAAARGGQRVETVIPPERLPRK